ncbi:response regulator [Polaromonas sp. P1-6]|nr:response regulator [Polaromonas sp. P1-6]
MQFNNQPFMVSGWLEKPIDENRLILGLRRAIAGITGDKPRILHVEDDQDIQRITAAISQDLATFVFAATLEEARAHLRSHLVDAVLLDLDLGPGGDIWLGSVCRHCTARPSPAGGDFFSQRCECRRQRTRHRYPAEDENF